MTTAPHPVRRTWVGAGVLAIGAMAQATEPPITPEVMDAVSMVLGLDRVAERSLVNCRSLPEGAVAVAAAADWRQRHAELLEAARERLQAARRLVQAEEPDPAKRERFDSMFDSGLQNTAFHVMWPHLNAQGAAQPDAFCRAIAADMTGKRMNLTTSDKIRRLLLPDNAAR